jgi:ABC-type sugar transport system permease subunit
MALSSSRNTQSVAALRTSLVGFSMVAPAFVALLYLRVMPAVAALWESFHQRSMFDQTKMVFVGLENYVFLLVQSPTFLQSVKVTIQFVVLTVAVQTLCALALAVLFTQRAFGTSFWRTLVFLPITIPTAVSAVVWGTAFRGDGIINGLLVAAGLSGQPFLASSSQALWSITIMASWIGVGYWMVFLIAGRPARHPERRARGGGARRRRPGADVLLRRPPVDAAAARLRDRRQHGRELPAVRAGGDPHAGRT